MLERAGEFGEVGAGLSLWPNALRALAALGVEERVRALGAVESAGGVRDRRGRWLSRLDNAEIARRHGRPLVVVHRADLVRALVEALPVECLRSGGEVRAVRPDGDAVVVEYRGGVVRPDGDAMVVEHRDGVVRPDGDAVVVEHRDGVVRADLVVGADGVHSGVRRQWWPEAAVPRYAGYTAWRMIAGPVAEPPAEGAVTWGRGERFGFTALPGGRFYCFAAATVPEGVPPMASMRPCRAGSPTGPIRSPRCWRRRRRAV
ncbi:2-polyprenyl-6-methoxyphenol hydroxylase-like FAD-dependent oxidoreductase [Saccharothrix ecbatanensis]|uniref:2-polyprenyl-6-methoxyphenol hydroxylase-like FAD-dependent oxidoreductase n=1 Tax=Saccharothrix ecbatanensis TaxID=1105145 RepID=A0A7W9HHZ1_9PSEU|nr:2-polyprenyl-6-methoxyphenol hydroxylase-like FAD-dependent oxidoreductase [Saccharothrix ecbatanensis]